MVKSYKDLPFNLYQFQTKFRDEPRPRFGLIRVREFIMKDAYSFDKDIEGLNVSYDKMFKAYKASFDRMGLNYKIVTADTGVMGGLLSEEFQALSDIGEDTLVLCDACDFSTNLEIAPCVTDKTTSNETLKALELLHTPNVGKIKDLIDAYSIPLEKMTKSMIYKIDGKFVLIMVRSDDEINEVKVQKFFKATQVDLASAEDVVRLTNAKVGFAGPHQISLDIYADHRIEFMTNFLIGANQSDYHYINANVERDFKVKAYGDFRNIVEGDLCPKCHTGHIHFSKGIEIGNTFKLGDKYSKALGLNYLDQNNSLQPVVMGSYGILWPKAIAPFDVAIVIINTKIEAQVLAATKIYEDLLALGIDVLLDDRDERAGVKFNDCDLIGVPLRITVGKTLENGEVEVKARAQKDVQLIKLEDLQSLVIKHIKS
jgi:prolyl-tRNA synthetase